MTYLQTLSDGVVAGAFAARDNARHARRLARQWPKSAAEYEIDARAAFARAYQYLRLARDFRSQAHAN